MEILENNTDLDFNKIIDIEKRENNTKRSFLLVNKYQAKHYPISPSKSIDMFKKLASEVKKELDGSEKITFVGFSETATAIGAYVAEEFENAMYLTTTREDIDDKYNVINFSEEHSHATNQAVFCKDADKFFGECDVLAFVEDEVTTGKTILNFIEAFKKSGYLKDDTKIIVSSILNNMAAENVDKFIKLGIKLVYLAKLVNNFENELENTYIDRQNLIKREEENGQIIYNDNECLDMITIDGRKEVRLGLESLEYKKACESLANELLKREFKSDKILVLGTEECMYPAIKVAKAIEEKYPNKIVRTHSTTRSPILPVKALNKRNELESLYEVGRTTYIYNLEKYDHVLIITDAESINNNGVFTLLEALREYDNKDILLVRWI